MMRARWLLLAVLAGCPKPPVAGPTDTLSRLDSVVIGFSVDAQSAHPRVTQTEAALQARLDEDTVRAVALLMIELWEASAGNAQASSARIAAQSNLVMARVGDLPYLRDLASVTGSGMEVLQAASSCGGVRLDCRTSCLDDATEQATVGLTGEALKAALDMKELIKKTGGAPMGIIVTATDLAECARGGHCDRDKLLRLARDLFDGTLVAVGGAAAIAADAPVLGLVIILEAVALSVKQMLADEQQRLQCCEDFRRQNCTARCPPPSHLCPFHDAQMESTRVLCCGADEGCYGPHCFFESGNACPSEAFCGDLCCASGMVCGRHSGACEAPGQCASGTQQCSDGNCCSPQDCVSGQCVVPCMLGTTRCSDGHCHDLGGDNANCGTCDSACGDGYTCVSGRCQSLCAIDSVEICPYPGVALADGESAEFTAVARNTCGRLMDPQPTFTWDEGDNNDQGCPGLATIQVTGPQTARVTIHAVKTCGTCQPIRTFAHAPVPTNPNNGRVAWTYVYFPNTPACPANPPIPPHPCPSKP